MERGEPVLISAIFSGILHSVARLQPTHTHTQMFGCSVCLLIQHSRYGNWVNGSLNWILHGFTKTILSFHCDVVDDGFSTIWLSELVGQLKTKTQFCEEIRFEWDAMYWLEWTWLEIFRRKLLDMSICGRKNMNFYVRFSKFHCLNKENVVKKSRFGSKKQYEIIGKYHCWPISPLLSIRLWNDTHSKDFAVKVNCTKIPSYWLRSGPKCAK